MLFKNTIQYENSENTSNKYVIRCMKIMIFIMIGIWLLNILNVFPINKNVVLWLRICDLYDTIEQNNSEMGDVLWELVNGLNKEGLNWECHSGIWRIGWGITIIPRLPKLKMEL